VTPSGTETILCSFTGGADGGQPFAAPIFDASGNLYGTTHVGGGNAEGTVFEFSASGTEIVLHSFGSTLDDGLFPYAGLVFDKKGNLYGTTFLGGASGGGTVFAVTPSSKTEKILHAFSPIDGDGVEPYAGVVFDNAKVNLYGTTVTGGSLGNGTLYELSLPRTETILHGFGASGDGSLPYGNVILDSKGNMYGTTSIGGKYDLGTVYRVAP
jgi:uncharacterized repeat protein (TIGR03803 family)